MILTVCDICRYYPVGVVCSTNNRGPIHFYTEDSEDTSTLNNVVIANVSVVQVSSKPPIMQNVTIEDTDTGLVLVGSGISNEHDVSINEVHVLQV